MPSPVLFGISVAFGLAVWGAVAWHYIWPALRERPSPENLKPILLLHGFRFLGLAFVVPGVVSPALPTTFANPRNLNPCSSRMGFRFSGLGRSFSSGQIYCHATAPQAAKPNAALIPNKTGDGMINPFRCNSRYHIVNVSTS